MDLVEKSMSYCTPPSTRYPTQPKGLQHHAKSFKFEFEIC